MKYGLIGEKLGHSYSKPIHEALADYTYEICEIARDEIADFLKKREFTAINVTIPYKEAVIDSLDEIDGVAGRIGAVNTVVNRGGRLYGYNTDAYGMMRLLEYAGISPRGRIVAILGTGGTSKTAAACAEELGAKEIIKVSRTGVGDAVSYDELYASHSDAEIIINTTPVGMYPNTDGCPVDLSRLPCLVGVVDAVYNPLRTELISEARRRGIAAEGGLYMLVAQAVLASEIFTARRYPPFMTDIVYKRIYTEKENIVLIGMPSSGKSTVGKIIAERLGRELCDTDEAIVNRDGRDIPKIFREDGESFFRALESEAVKECAKGSSLVIATGGGVPLREENITALKRGGMLFFIDRPLSDLVSTPDRPLSKSREALDALYRERYPIYTSVCDARIDGSGTPEEVADRIIKEFCK